MKVKRLFGFLAILGFISAVILVSTMISHPSKFFAFADWFFFMISFSIACTLLFYYLVNSKKNDLFGIILFFISSIPLFLQLLAFFRLINVEDYFFDIYLSLTLLQITIYIFYATQLFDRKKTNIINVLSVIAASACLVLALMVLLKVPLLGSSLFVYIMGTGITILFYTALFLRLKR